jgi:3-phosphoglycerate kinase
VQCFRAGRIIGSQSAQEIADIIMKAGTVVWNRPVVEILKQRAGK